MKAVNLIPQTERRGGSAVSRSGGGAYLVLGTLAALVLMMGVYALEGGKIGSKQAEAAQSTKEAVALEAKADALSQYSAFADLKNKRVDTVTEIAGERFDWSDTLHDLARVIPPNTWLTCLRGTVTPDVAASACGGGGTGASVRAAIAQPAMELTGCTTSQPAVARMMAKMRNINNVTRVSLTSSEKLDQAAGSTSGGDSSGDSSDCRQGNDQFPQFEMVVFFKPLPGQASTAAAASGAAAPTATTSTTGASQ
jgi:Tfp pilus assembly protein PilN